MISAANERAKALGATADMTTQEFVAAVIKGAKGR